MSKSDVSSVSIDSSDSSASSVSIDSSDSSALKPSTFIRHFVLRNPKAKLEDIQNQWDKEGHLSSMRPNKSQSLYSAHNFIKRKYGIKSIDQIPFKKSGEINITGCLRLIRKRNPNITEKACRALVANDGLFFSSALWSLMLKSEKHSNLRKLSEEVPRDNKVITPIIKIGIRKMKNTISDSRITNHEVKGKKLLEIESTLDDLIQKTREVNSGEVVKILKNARRYISQSIINS